jgi:hypothetical protein
MTSIRYGEFVVIDSGKQVRIESREGGHSLLLPKQAWAELVGAWSELQKQRPGEE